LRVALAPCSQPRAAGGSAPHAPALRPAKRQTGPSACPPPRPKCPSPPAATSDPQNNPPGPARAALLCQEGLSGLLEFTGDAPAARAALAAAARARRPLTARFLREAALLEKRAGAPAAAAALFRRAVAVDPRDYKTWLAWGVLERRRRNFEAAAECFAAAARAAPGNPHVWYAWATMEARDVRDAAEAQRLLRRATQLCPR
jgi:tetratricopeptide (TPR) repeat protein